MNSVREDKRTYFENVLFDPKDRDEADDENSGPREVQSVSIVVRLGASAQ